jgi:anthranilate phosphoribosyltransferase
MEKSSDNQAGQPFKAAPFIKEIGRGQRGARSMSRSEARELYAAMLDGRVSDLELGAIVLAMRIKGESVEELAGFLDAAEASFEQLEAPAGPYAPVVIPSYNGARHMANLTPLLALLLAREGVPVLVHGVAHDPRRVTTAEVFAALGIAPSPSVADAGQAMAQRRPAFMTIETLAPKIAQLLALRAVLGVRGSTHSVVKVMQPCAGPALRLGSYTHPEYLTLLTAYFSTAAPFERGDIFLMRGTEGETVANARRGQQIEWFHRGVQTTLIEKQAPTDEVPPLPAQRDAVTTAAWITAALAGEQPIPAPIAQQVKHCMEVARRLRETPQSA